MTVRATTTVVLALLVALATAAPASAKVRWHRCPDVDGPRCATVRVPLDRSGGLAGQVELNVARVAFARKRSPHLMYLSGGPGGAGVFEMIDVLFEVPRLAREYTVLGFDQRGTGRSGLLRCKELERDGRLRSTTAGERCAQRLGPARAFYTTPDSVADMEAIRAAVGAPKLTLFGISYGTQLALAYARAHPTRVERLILDSTADPDESDPFGLAGFRAMAPSLASLCPEECRGISTDPAADVSALTAKLRAAPLSGNVFDERGRRTRRTLRPTAIADLFYDADYNPALRAGIPMAVRAALDHDDAAPLLQLLAAAATLSRPSDPRDFSAARYATVCEETPLPWPRGTPMPDRFQVARNGALALPPAAFAPFDAEVAYADEIDLCLRWPDPGQPPYPRGGAYPRGADAAAPGRGGPAHAARDLRAHRLAHPRRPAGDGARRRARDRRRGLQRLRPAPTAALRRRRSPSGRAARACATDVPATAVPPTALAQLAPAAGLTGKLGRTVSAVDATLDYMDLALSPALDVDGRGGGLRGGTFRSGRRLTMDGVVVVPGVRISGRALRSGALRLRVRGAAASHGR